MNNLAFYIKRQKVFNFEKGFKNKCSIKKFFLVISFLNHFLYRVPKIK